MNKTFSHIISGVVLVVAAITMFTTHLDVILLSKCLLITLICAFTIRTVKWDSMSFVSIYLLMNIVTYSFAVLGNMFLPHPAVRADLWSEVHFATQGAIVGLGAFAFGVWVYSKKDSGKSTQFFSTTPVPVTKVKFNILLTIVPLSTVVFVQMALGLYYHSSVGIYEFSHAKVNNALSYLLWFGYLGIFLQFYRTSKTCKTRDMMFALALTVVAILLFLPSGSRERAFGFLPLLILAYLTWEKRQRYLYVFLVVITTVLIIGIVVVGSYRGVKNVRNIGIADKLTLLQSTTSKLSAGQDEISLFVGRLSDFVPVGRIIHWTPEKKPYRYFYGMQNWWRIILPGVARSYFDLPLNFNEGAETTYNYRISRHKTSSNPSMNIGSLFSRFGWFGMAAGMFILGILIRKMDFIFSRHHPLFRLIFWLLLAKRIWRLYTTSSLILFVTFTRDLVIIYILSLLIFKILIKCGVVVKPLGASRPLRRQIT